MIAGIERTGTVESPSWEEVSAWVAETSLEMRDLPMLKNAWKKSGYNWFEGEVVEEGNADDTDDNNGNDYNDMEDIVDDVLGNDKDEDDDNYDAVADNDMNSEDGNGGKLDSNNKEEEFFPMFKEEEGVTVTTTE